MGREVRVAGDQAGAGVGSRRQQRSIGGAGARGSRAQDQRAAAAPRKAKDQPWVRPSSLPDIPARPGMVQRWVRVGVEGRPDPRNIAMREREGWLPRKAESVPKDIPVPRIDHGRYNGCVGVAGMVLFEMPKERNNERKKAIRGKINGMTESIDEELIRASAGGRRGGFGPIVRNQTSKRVREVRPADDVGDTADDQADRSEVDE